MHAGVDIPGPIGTPIYATADGVIGRAGRFGGYGNLITVNHGKGIETRYGHLSKILVAPNTRVRRGQMIGNKIAQRNFSDRNLPSAAAMSAILTLAVLAPLLLRRPERGSEP